MPTLIKYVQSDFNKPIGFTLQNADGSAFDLTNYSVVLNAQFANTPGIKFTGSCAVDSAPGGTCHYTPLATDFNEWGTYLIQLVCTNSSSGAVVTFTDIVVQASKKLPTN